MRNFTHLEKVLIKTAWETIKDGPKTSNPEEEKANAIAILDDLVNHAISHGDRIADDPQRSICRV